jgi:hypothetical protein
VVAIASVLVAPATAAPPVVTVAFGWTPAAPVTGQLVTFTSTSTTVEPNSIVGEAWDLDGDGQYDDASGRVATRRFSVAGAHQVGLRVIDKHGEQHQHVLLRTVTVVEAPRDRPPVASFVHYPASPFAGEVVNFHSTSTDPDSPIDRQLWDLDGDGRFGDATGPAAAHAFTEPGTYTVSLQVVDTQGAASVATEQLAVDPAGSGRLQRLAGSRGLAMLSPFPVVRLSGVITARGIRIRRLTVTAPRGSLVTVRCHGRGCRFSRYARTARAGGAPEARIASVVRLRRLERRLLRAGARLRIFVTKGGAIGKYTRFRVRKARPPARRDLCLLPSKREPVRCPFS